MLFPKKFSPFGSIFLVFPDREADGPGQSCDEQRWGVPKVVGTSLGRDREKEDDCRSDRERKENKNPPCMGFAIAVVRVELSFNDTNISQFNQNVLIHRIDRTH